MAAYLFAPGSEENSYLFSTKNKLVYTIVFKNSSGYFTGNEILYNSNLVYEIVLSHSSLGAKQKKEHDTAVSITIHKILSDHLSVKGELPLYFFVCSMDDRKEAARASLFIKWYDSVNDPDWQLYNYELFDEANNETIYCGLLVNNNHPNFAQVSTEFENFIQDSAAGKHLFNR
jgi:hypothetical protein